MRGDELSPLSVYWVAETWMISLLDSVAFAEHTLANVIEVLDPSWEPWHLRRSDLGYSIGDETELRLSLPDVLVRSIALYVDVEVNLPPVVVDELGGPRRDPRHVDPVGCQDV